MIGLETFKLLNENEDKEFVLKVIQAEAIVNVNTVKPVARLARDYGYLGLTKEHFDYALKLNWYDKCFRMYSTLGDYMNKPEFPLV